MATGADADAEAALRAYATELADAIDRALPGWVRRCVERFVPVEGTVAADVEVAARRVREETGSDVRTLLVADIDAQRSTPLALMRHAVAAPTAILRNLGVPSVPRDEFDERAFPDDVYRLTPATFGDIDPDLQEPGLRWGAAKAFVFKQRRRHEGKS